MIKKTWGAMSKYDKFFMSCLFLFGIGQIIVGVLMIVKS
jgi:hypothetical protein